HTRWPRDWTSDVCSSDLNPDRQVSDTRPLGSWGELLGHFHPGWPPAVQTKWLEFLLRTTPAAESDELAAACVRAWRALPQRAGDTLRLLRAVFNDVALSPWTDFVDKTLAFLRRLVERQYLTAEQHVDS